MPAAQRGDHDDDPSLSICVSKVADRPSNGYVNTSNTHGIHEDCWEVQEATQQQLQPLARGCSLRHPGSKLHSAPPSYYEEMCAIWTMAWKVSLTTFCRLSLATISTAFLGHLGLNELAAGALTRIWTGAVQILIFGFAVSLCTLCGQAYGAKNYELIGIWFQLALISLTVFSIPVFVSYFYVDSILSVVTQDPEVLRLVNIYARWSAPTVWPQTIYCAMRQYLQAQGIVTPATIVSVLSVVVCIVANYVLIYGFGPIPALHFIGSPIAQCVASFFQPIALWVYAFWYKGYHKPTWFGFTWECLRLDRVKRFVYMSIGMAINMALDEWVYNAISTFAGYLGALQLDANSILSSLWGLIFGVFWGFGLPTQVRTANFLGANDPVSAKRTMRVGFLLGGLSAALSAIFVYVFRKSVVRFFTPDPHIAVMIESALPQFCFGVFLSGLHIILAAVVEAMSLASTLVCITASGSWLVMLPMAYYFAFFAHLGLKGLWWGSICGEATKLFLMVCTLLRVDWYAMAALAIHQSEVTMDDQEVEEEVEILAAFLTAPITTPVSPVISSFSTAQQVHHDRHGMDWVDSDGNPLSSGRCGITSHGERHRTLSYGTSDG